MGGTYGLGLTLLVETQLRVGARGSWRFPAGSYLYVGSAWGPGGLRARVGRHLAGSKRQRWHIDYLRQAAHPTGLWLAPGERLECAWAHDLATDPAAQVIVPHFGASDCTCIAHLFYLPAVSPARLALPGARPYMRLAAGFES